MPKIIGGVTRACAAAPALILTSSGLTPLDATRTSTSPAAGTGRGTLRSAGSAPNSSRTTAFMVSMTANLRGPVLVTVASHDCACVPGPPISD